MNTPKTSETEARGGSGDLVSLLADWEFRKDLERLVANAVCEALTRRLPIKAVEAGWICRAHAVNHRFDVTRCGQDSSASRLNLTTDGKGNVKRIVIG